jgi:tetratricopeptide (TPR) repeat protein
VAFRHELARLAVEQAAAPDRKLRLHRSTLAALRAAPRATADLARLAHHAESARDTDAVLEFAPAAGARASKVGAHREAAAQYARALRFADGLPLAERAELLGCHTIECYVTTQDDAALTSSRQALDAWRQLRKPLKEAESLANVARVALNMGFTEEATEAAREAASVLEKLPPGPHLARVYDLIGGASLLFEDAADTERWSRRAVEIAEQVEDRYTVVSALSILGEDTPGTAERRRRARTIPRSGAGPHA